jgi:hypothetical protein
MMRENVQSQFFREVQTCFDQASAKVDVIRQFYQLAGCTFCLEFASPVLALKFSIPLAHLRIEEPKQLSFHICFWDAKSSGIFPPSPPWKQCEIREKGEIPAFSTELIKAIFYIDQSVLNLVHLGEKKGFYWIRDAEAVPYGEIASPVRVALSFFMQLYRRQFVHAAAIGDERGAVLLVGKGGAGKSTTSLVCLDQGMQFLGDDYCILSNDSGPKVHALYAMGKLHPSTLEKFPSFQSLERASGSEKEIVYLSDRYCSQMPAEKPIQALLIPRIGNYPKTHVQPASFSAAITALVPSTIFQLPGTDHATLQTLSAWLKSVPSYFLHLSPDIQAVPGVIRKFLREIQ